MAATPADRTITISGRLLGQLVTQERLRRLRIAHRADKDLYSELLTLSAVLLGSATGTKVVVTAGPPGESGLLGTATAARRAGATPRAIRKAISEHRLAATRISGRWLIRPADLNAYIRNRQCLPLTNAAR
jgi:excisionase family DNA binding protein